MVLCYEVFHLQCGFESTLSIGVLGYGWCMRGVVCKELLSSCSVCLVRFSHCLLSLCLFCFVRL